MSRIQNPAPDATRRRASTNRKMETIMRLARRLPLTRQVLADQLETATPSQMEFMDQWMNAEIESRERSKRSRLLKQAGFPAVKTLDGYDWENIRFPVDWGRRSLESLEFASRPEDVVMFGPPGTTAESVAPVAEQVYQGMVTASPADYQARAAASVTGPAEEADTEAPPVKERKEGSVRDQGGRSKNGEDEKPEPPANEGEEVVRDPNLGTKLDISG